MKKLPDRFSNKHKFYKYREFFILISENSDRPALIQLNEEIIFSFAFSSVETKCYTIGLRLKNHVRTLSKYNFGRLPKSKLISFAKSKSRTKRRTEERIN